MKKVKNIAKKKLHQSKKQRNRKTKSEIKARGRAYGQTIKDQREKRQREFEQFVSLMSQSRDLESDSAQNTP